MRKLAFLMACLMLLTVGGVYAAWLYTDANSDVIDAHAESIVTLAGATTTGAAGTFTITTNLVMTIDQSEITKVDGKDVNEHKAVLVYAPTVEGENIHLTITFTPNTNAPQTVKDHGIDAELYFKTTTEMKYSMDANGNYVAEGGTPKEIFTFGSYASDGTFAANILSTDESAADSKKVWVKDPETGAFSVTYTGDELKAIIKLNDNGGADAFVLDTKQEYDAFSAALTGNIAAYITDGIVNSTSGGTGEQG